MTFFCLSDFCCDYLFLCSELLSRILYLIVPSMSVSHTAMVQPLRLAAKTRKLAKSYFGDVGQAITEMPCNLSATLDELYEWEKKLYKEVKVMGTTIRSLLWFLALLKDLSV